MLAPEALLEAWSLGVEYGPHFRSLVVIAVVRREEKAFIGKFLEKGKSYEIIKEMFIYWFIYNMGYVVYLSQLIDRKMLHLFSLGHFVSVPCHVRQ